jgi:phosphoglycolate phosphatase-like HAD superfamily hydrolase
VESAKRAGVAAIFVDRGYGERRPINADAVVASLPNAVEFIESQRVRGRSAV